MYLFKFFKPLKNSKKNPIKYWNKRQKEIIYNSCPESVTP